VPVNTLLRASDADRDHALAQLREHYAAGRLSDAERQERAGAALAARTLGELSELMTDLPDPGPPARREGTVGGPSFRLAQADQAAGPRPAAAVTVLGAIVALYVLTGLLTGIWWIPWALIIVPAVRAIRYARYRRAAVSAG
jgi:Domain of unknown function (DUF1707)